MPWYVVVVEKWGFVLLCCGHVLCVCCRGRFGDVIHVSIPNFDPVDDILALFETEYQVDHGMDDIRHYGTGFSKYAFSDLS